MCILCLRCVEMCPQKNCLSLNIRLRKNEQLNRQLC
jgi:NAD-dependent dihydropyrimidine dehydrogenase PreA subunit